MAWLTGTSVMLGNNICYHPDDTVLRVSLIIPAGLPSHVLRGLGEKQCWTHTGLAAIQIFPQVRYQSLTPALDTAWKVCVPFWPNSKQKRFCRQEFRNTIYPSYWQTTPFFRLKHHSKFILPWINQWYIYSQVKRRLGFFVLGHYHYLAFIMFCLNSWKPLGGSAWRLLNKAISLWFVLAAAPLLVRIQWLKRLLLIWVWLQCFPFEKNNNN